MSVEQANTSVNSKLVSVSDGRSGVGKVKAGANQPAASLVPGGFTALLASLEEPAAAATSPGDSAGSSVSSLVEPHVTTWEPATPEAGWDDLTMLLGQQAVQTTQTLVPTDAPVSDGVFEEADAQRISTLLAPAAATIATETATAMPAVTPTLIAAIATPAAVTPTLIAAIATPTTVKPTLTAETATSNQFLAAQKPEGNDLSKIGQPTVMSLLSSFLPDPANQSLVVSGRRPASVQPTWNSSSTIEAQLLRSTNVVNLISNEPLLPAAFSDSDVSAELVNQAVRFPAKPALGLVATALESSFAQHALTPGGIADFGAVSATYTSSLEFAVAEQVTYWVAQGIQNAQLTLDGFGSEAVEVSISLNGQEAQIDFRTDQPEVRQMLEGALSQLKDTLAREGLVLLDVSVGASGQESAGGQERRPKPNSRQVAVSTSSVGHRPSLHQASLPVGRAIDIFV